MALAISEEHKDLADVAASHLVRHKVLGVARETLDSASVDLPAFWSATADLGWLGLHLPEEYGGSGAGLPELAIVVEELGRGVAPGPFLPTVIASAVLAELGDDALRSELLPGLAEGTSIGAVGWGGDLRRAADGAVTGA